MCSVQCGASALVPYWSYILRHQLSSCDRLVVEVAEVGRRLRQSEAGFKAGGQLTCFRLRRGLHSLAASKGVRSKFGVKGQRRLAHMYGVFDNLRASFSSCEN